MRNKFKVTTFIIVSIISLMVIYLHLFSHRQTQEIYVGQTKKVIIDLKKDFLKDTVNNIFFEIDKLRETKNNNFNNNTAAVLRGFNESLESTDERFIKVFKKKFSEELNPEIWTALLWDNERQRPLYATSDLQNETITGGIEDIKPSLGPYTVIKKGNIEGIFGVSKSYIDQLVKDEIEDIIKGKEFSNDSYIWVNEILNYEGGKDYAIRRIHPNLKDNEEFYLSTDMEDIKGNLPYLEELEGIKKNGELFFTYYLNELDGGQESEKITYSKFYKDFDWIVAMGVHLDVIDAYTEETNSAIGSLSSVFIIRALRNIFLVLLMGFLILYFIEKNHLSKFTEFLEQEINVDVLTNAYSRRFGIKSLKTYFKKHPLEEEKVAIMMFDIDDFKDINDSYGHSVGDMVLVEIVNNINNIIRSSDQLIRWGGDEFIVILPGLKEENMMGLGEKILKAVSSIEIIIEEEIVRSTISIGFSYFRDTDIDYNDVIKRIDDAMYKSKKEGKNKVTII